ncbi:MAG: hypothetical protein ACFFCI_03405 [Promethearchaeota archaeon]
MSMKYMNYLKNDDEEENGYNYLDIWNRNPCDIDTNTLILKAKFVIFVLYLLAIWAILAFIYSKINLLIPSAIVLFLLLFYERFYDIFVSFYSKRGGIKEVNPCKDLIFWVNDSETLITINKKMSVVFAVRIFKITNLPESVQPTLNHFLKTLYNANIEYSYQVVQTPLNYQNRPNKTENHETSIYFSVFAMRSGILTKTTIQNLFEHVKINSKIFNSHLSSNFHHTQIKQLFGGDLIRAIRAIFCGVNIDSIDFTKVEKNNSKIDGHFITKLVIITLFVGFFTCSLTLFSLSWIIILLLDILIIMLFIPWWEDLLYNLSKLCFLKNISVQIIDPFKDIKFYQLNKCPSSLFILFPNKLLIGLKIFNLYDAIQKCFIFPDKFYRELNKHTIPYSYTLQATPISPKQFSKRCFKFLNEKGLSDIRNIFGQVILDKSFTSEEPGYWPPRKDAELVFKNWISMRTGIWNTILTVSVFSHTFLYQPNVQYFYELEDELADKSEIAMGAFQDNFLNLRLRELQYNTLINGYLFLSLKNSLFKAGDSHLSKVYFQGKNVIPLSTISNEFKKGLPTKIAAEFNSPIHLKNDIVIGETINTEFLEHEGELGFLHEQINHLLITNGFAEQRELTMMKIVVELTKLGKQCVIFDYSGNWSKIIGFFTNTYLQNAFLYFKLGQNFTINLIKSDIKYDKRNVEYLNLFYDVFSLAFKAYQQDLDILKENLAKNDDFDLNDMALDKEMEKQLFKQKGYSSLLTLLHGFVDWKALFSSKSINSPNDIKPIDFIKNDKTIIIDLSLLEELSQKNFVSFVIVSKFVHYLQNSANYQKKIIIIPEIDLFFDANYIDNYKTPVDYGKIKKFFDPLFHRGYGLIFSVDQPRFLHPYLLKYFPNIIAFNANDTRDIAVLKNQMNLQELQGTGYYSSKRNNTYQIEYLKNLRENEVLVKRSDIDQPFPGEIDYDDLFQISPLKQDNISAYMEKLGFNFIELEKKVMLGAKDCLFEKDLGPYFPFIEEIITFLNAVRTVDKVGGNYENKLKEVLLRFIYPKASKKFRDKRKINEIRNYIFRTLKMQGYLIESHPPQASGSYTVRTCYRVGDKYYKALEEYYRIKEKKPLNISVEVIKKETNNNSIASRISTNLRDELSAIKESRISVSSEAEHKLRHVLAENLGNTMRMELFHMYKAIGKKDYATFLKVAKQFVLRFFARVYWRYYRSTKAFTKGDIEGFMRLLTDVKGFPYTLNSLHQLIEESESINIDHKSSAQRIEHVYQTLLQFYIKLKSYVEMEK